MVAGETDCGVTICGDDPDEGNPNRPNRTAYHLTRCKRPAPFGGHGASGIHSQLEIAENLRR